MVMCFPDALLMNSCNTETHNKTVSVPSAGMRRSSAKPGRYFFKDQSTSLQVIFSIRSSTHTSKQGERDWKCPCLLFTVEADQLVVLLSVMTPESHKSARCNEFHVFTMCSGFLKTFMDIFDVKRSRAEKTAHAL